MVNSERKTHMKLKKRKRIGYALLALLFALFVTAMPVSMAADGAGDEIQASSSLADWILGTDFGVVSGAIDMDNRRVMLLFSQEKLASLSMQDDEDIRAAIDDILIFYHLAEAAGTYDIRYEAEDGAAAADESRYSGMCASSLAIISVAYGQQSFFRPGPRNLPNSQEAAQGNQFSR